MKKSIFFAIFLIGFTAMGAQIVLLRQLIVIFYGNEISVGLLLFAWLFWGAAGSWLLGRFADKIKHRRFIFALLQILLAFILPGLIFIVRNARTILGALAGELIGLLPMAAFSFVALSLICVILGFLFALACRIYPAEKQAASGIGRVYILEALGAVIGGGLVSFFLIRYLDAFYIMLGFSLLNLISAYFLQSQLIRPRFVALARLLSLALALILFALLFNQKAKALKEISIEQQWRGFTLLESRDSIYNNLAVTGRKNQFSFFSNGLYLFTVGGDDAAKEEAVHFALLETPDPKRALLIGGGLSGLAKEALKHPLIKLDYVEFDPQVIKLAQKHLPEEDLKFLEDPRIQLHHQDGRLFIKRLSLEEKQVKYDTIIASLGDPYTAQINRFYTLEFFREAKKCLAPGGVFSFSLSSSENFLNPEQERLLSSIHSTLTKVFNEVKVIPGDTAYFLATDKQGTLTYDYRRLEQRLKQRNIRTKFMRQYYLFAKLSEDRIDYLEQRIAARAVRLNTDFRPVSYYYDMLLWISHFKQPWRKVFSHFNQRNIWGYFCLVYLSILVFAFRRRKKDSSGQGTALLAVSSTGFTELCFQIVTLLSFQIIYGYLYYKLGIILSSFMLGLVLGAWVITNRMDRIKNDYEVFIKTQLAISIYPLILPFVFFIFNAASATKIAGWTGGNIIFPLLPAVSGFIGGFQFPLANRIILKQQRNIGRTAGKIYGMDLLGSCLGAALISAFLVPILGINQSCLAVALLGLTVFIALIMNKS